MPSHSSVRQLVSVMAPRPHEHTVRSGKPKAPVEGQKPKGTRWPATHQTTGVPKCFISNDGETLVWILNQDPETISTSIDASPSMTNLPSAFIHVVLHTTSFERIRAISTRAGIDRRGKWMARRICRCFAILMLAITVLTTVLFWFVVKRSSKQNQTNRGERLHGARTGDGFS